MLVAGEIDIWSGYVYCLEADMEKAFIKCM